MVEELAGSPPQDKGHVSTTTSRTPDSGGALSVDSRTVGKLCDTNSSLMSWCELGLIPMLAYLPLSVCTGCMAGGPQQARQSCMGQAGRRPGQVTGGGA